MTATAPTRPSSDTVANAIEALKAEADRQGGCPYELWIARLNLEADRLAASMSDDNRSAFLAQAAADGLHDPEAETGWLLEADDDHCAHGLDPYCCPCGCGDIE